MLLCNCSSTSVLMIALSSGTRVTRRNKSVGQDEFFFRESDHIESTDPVRQ